MEGSRKVEGPVEDSHWAVGREEGLGYCLGSTEGGSVPPHSTAVLRGLQPQLSAQRVVRDVKHLVAGFVCKLPDKSMKYR